MRLVVRMSSVMMLVVLVTLAITGFHFRSGNLHVESQRAGFIVARLSPLFAHVGTVYAGGSWTEWIVPWVNSGRFGTGVYVPWIPLWGVWGLVIWATFRATRSAPGKAAFPVETRPR